MAESETAEMKLKAVDQVSFAVKDIDETIEAWSSMYGIGPWTFAENGGTDAKGRIGWERFRVPWGDRR